MLRRICKYSLKTRNTLVRHNSQLNEISVNKNDFANIDVAQVETYSPKPSKSVLEPLDEDISHISSYLKPTFNFAAYINKSDTLQQLLKLGVNFYEIEKKVEAVEFILGLKFEDIKEHIIFLGDVGLDTEKIGTVITKNPFILKEDLDDLKIRINYLEYKKFTKDMITHIVQTNAFWLSKSTQQIDEALGFFQSYFGLKGDEVRLMAVKAPKLITTSISKVKANTFVLKEEMGFNEQELKTIILKKPNIFTSGQNRILKSFEYLHKNMNLSLERIVQEAEILTTRQRKLMERHLFLDKLGKAQYDPKKPNYVALISLVSGSDSHFCTEIAKSSIQAYNAFCKSL